MYGIPDEPRADLKGRIRGRKEALDAAAVNSMRAKLVALGLHRALPSRNESPHNSLLRISCTGNSTRLLSFWKRGAALQ